MKMLRAVLLIVAVGLSCAALSGNSAPASSEEASALSAEISNTSARATVERLSSQDGQHGWNQLLRNVKTGSADWLDVAGKLAAGTDAGTSEDLQVALAYALPKNPERVLALVGTQSFLKVDEVCGAPFIEPTTKFLRRYLRDTRRALTQSKEMSDVRKQCLQHIVEAQKQLSSPGS